jgi:HSP20 family protein
VCETKTICSLVTAIRQKKNKVKGEIIMRNGLTLYRNSIPSVWNMSDVDEIFERAFRNPFSLLDDFDTTPVSERDWIQPHFELDEQADSYVLNIDLPGVKKEDVKIDLTNNMLTVSGERTRKNLKFLKSFSLPPAVDVEKVEANLEDGVLKIALPKSEAAKPRTIQIQGSSN